MKHLVIIHGAVLRGSTFKWTKLLSNHFENQDFQCHRFFWSGIPFSPFLRKASKSFQTFYNNLCYNDNDIFTFSKSLGCDIINVSYDSLKKKPSRMIFLAPAFKLSKEMYWDKHKSTLYNIRLSKDCFMEKWRNIGLIHSLPIKSEEYIILNDNSFDHHELNWDIEIKFKDLGQLRLYDLYDRILG